MEMVYSRFVVVYHLFDFIYDEHVISVKGFTTLHDARYHRYLYSYNKGIKYKIRILALVSEYGIMKSIENCFRLKELVYAATSFF